MLALCTLAFKKQKLDVLAAMAGCARQDALAEQLCRHAEAGNADGVREVLAEGADVDKGIFTDTYSKGELREITPPHAGMPCVLALLEAGADLEKSAPNGNALHLATANDREAIIRALIKEGANVDARSPSIAGY